MAEETNLIYKEYPLARVGNDIYYGNPTDPYVVYIQVVSSKDVNGTAVADRVQVMLLSTDSSKSMRERVIRVNEKASLYLALEIGNIWLKKALSENK